VSSRFGRFFKTWIAPILEDGVLVADGEPGAARILPAADWLEALERVRQRTDEDADNRKQAERYAESRRKYRGHLAAVRRGEIPAKADKGGELLGRDRMAPVLEEREREAEQRRLEEERTKIGVTPSTFLADELAGTSGARYRELGDRWVARGGKRKDLQRAVQEGPYRFQREADDYLYVYPAHTEPEERAERPDIVRPLHPRPRALPYKNSDGVYVHSPLCSCEWCDEDLEPRYAKPALIGGGA
jgi:hypothetical protein